MKLTYKRLPKEMTMEESYGVAMEIDNNEDADMYFEMLVKRQEIHFGQTREEAEKLVRDNLGYYSCYYDRAIQKNVEKLFKCKHPILGTVKDRESLSQSDIIKIGMKHAEEHFKKIEE